VYGLKHQGKNIFSFRFIGHFPCEPGLAGFIGAMDVVVTTVAVSGAKPSQIVATDKPTSSSLRAGWHDALPVAQSTVSKH